MLSVRLACRLHKPAAAAVCSGIVSTSSLRIAGSSSAPSSATVVAAPSYFTSKAFCSSSDLATTNPNLAPASSASSPAGSEQSSPAGEPSAHVADLAKRVNATKRAHQTATADERKRLERAAWGDLNTLTEEQIAGADGQAVAILLNAWGYFSKFWERGKEGPM